MPNLTRATKFQIFCKISFPFFIISFCLLFQPINWTVLTPEATQRGHFWTTLSGPRATANASVYTTWTSTILNDHGRQNDLPKSMPTSYLQMASQSRNQNKNVYVPLSVVYLTKYKH